MQEVVLAFPPTVEPVRNVRSTVLVGAMTSMKEAGHFDRYTAALPAAHKDTLLHLVGGTWLPIEVAVAHYQACDAMGLSDEEQYQLGGATFARVRGSVLGTVLQSIGKVGMTPWTLFPQLQRFWNRAYDGGGIQIVRTGPKDALVHVVKCRLFEARQFRNSLRATLRGVVELLGEKAYVTERQATRAEGTITLRAQWV